MYINGTPDYNKDGNEVKTCCIFGKAVKDGEVRAVSGGKNVASVSVKACNKKDGSAEFVTVKAWDGPFLKAIGNTQKGDAMMACGRLNTREYGGKTYVDLMVDYYMYIPENGGIEMVTDAIKTFNANNEESELPF